MTMSSKNIVATFTVVQIFAMKITPNFKILVRYITMKINLAFASIFINRTLNSLFMNIFKIKSMI